MKVSYLHNLFFTNCSEPASTGPPGKVNKTLLKMRRSINFFKKSISAFCMASRRKNQKVCKYLLTLNNNDDNSGVYLTKLLYYLPHSFNKKMEIIQVNKRKNINVFKPLLLITVRILLIQLTLKTIYT